MSLRSPLRSAFREGGGTSTLVPGLWDCAIQGHTFMFDWKYAGQEQFTRSSIKLLRPQQETGSISEQSLNPADGVRAKIESWHHGAGQTFLDRDGSDPYRFASSKGVDPWTRWKLTLLPDTDQKVSTSGTNLYLQPAGARLYFTDGQTLKYLTDLDADSPTATTVTGTPAAAAAGVASDGYTVWTAFGASGVYDTNTGTGAAASRTTGTVGGPLGYVKGRLMAANDNSIYNITSLSGAAAALPAALYTHPNTDFRWVGFAEGSANIYAAGYSGGKSLIYKTSIKADGTALDVPTVAGELPDGEIVRSIGSYLGLVVLGTDEGVWVAEQDSAGNLAVNKVVENISPVYAFEGQGDFVWFGWTNYDSASTGLGRMDLKSDVGGENVITPPYASDLMAATQGTVQSVAFFDNLTVFTVSGVGIWAQTSTYVTSGTLDSGLITHGMPDEKASSTVTVTHEPLVGSINVALSTDGETFTSRGLSAAAGSLSGQFSTGAAKSEVFELRLTLTRGSTTTRPFLTRLTLESNPAPGRGERFMVPLLFREVLNEDGTHRDFRPADEYAWLVNVEADGTPVTYQDCLGSETVILDDHDFVIERMTNRRDAYEGTYLLAMRRPRRGS